MDDPRIGTTLGNYRIERLIGEGGMGVVYLAQHLRMNLRKAALKVLAPKYADDPDFRERFIRESDLAGTLEHPSIIPVFDAGEDGGVLYCAMRYVDGIDLKEEIERSNPLDPAVALDVLGHVASALDFAHQHGLVHRDVKPGNVMLEGSGPTRRVFLTDFGLVKRMRSDSTGTQLGLFLGTLDYAAPEQVQAVPVDGRTDEYALCAVLVECLTGEPPFVGETEAQLIGAHLTQSPPSVSARRPELPAALDAVVARGMAKEKELRFGTCTELIAAARTALARHAAAPAGTFRPATEVAFPPPLAEAAPRAAQPQRPVAPLPEGPTRPVARPGSPSPQAPVAAGRRRRDPLVVAIALLILASAVGFLVAADQGTGPGSKHSPRASSPGAAAVATSPFLEDDPFGGKEPKTGVVTLGTQRFEKSIFYRNPSGTLRTSYALDGRWTTFDAWVGIEPDPTDSFGSCNRDTFGGHTSYEVDVDGEQVQQGDIPCRGAIHITAPVAGASDLRLVMKMGSACTSADGSCSGDFAWGNARLSRT
jgi:serine/threonine protein kinase